VPDLVEKGEVLDIVGDEDAFRFGGEQ